MKYEFQLLIFFIAIGLLAKKFTWRGWYVIALIVVAWIAYNWKKA